LADGAEFVAALSHATATVPNWIADPCGATATQTPTAMTMTATIMTGASPDAAEAGVAVDRPSRSGAAALARVDLVSAVRVAVAQDRQDPARAGFRLLAL
jgi:hypothetical protein